MRFYDLDQAVVLDHDFLHSGFCDLPVIFGNFSTGFYRDVFDSSYYLPHYLALVLTIYLSKCKPETAIHATDKRQIMIKLLFKIIYKPRPLSDWRNRMVGNRRFCL